MPNPNSIDDVTQENTLRTTFLQEMRDKYKGLSDVEIAAKLMNGMYNGFKPPVDLREVQNVVVNR